MPRIIAHVDMDAFYASVEQVMNPTLRGKPVIVGADPKGGKGRGVVAGCSYEAREFGVHSGQPISLAYRLCPHGTYLRPNFQLYEEVSRRIMDVLTGSSDRLEQVSIDEAFLDITGVAGDYSGARALALKIKEAIKRDEGLTCSIGVAPNKAVAKIASDHQKPDGLTIVEPENVRDFLKPLPVSKIIGVGPKTAGILKALGIETIGQLADQPRSRLFELFGKYGLRLWDLANGISDDDVRPAYEAKSISSEITFEEDVADRTFVLNTIKALAEEIHGRAAAEGYWFRTIGIKVRFEDFTTFTRSRSHQDYTDKLGVILAHARALFREFEGDPRRIRLVGIRVSGLKKPDGRQEKLLAWSASTTYSGNC